MRRASWILVPVFCLLGYLTLGIPGALIFEVGMGTFELVTGRPLRANIAPDAAWPLAIYLSLLWPFSLPLAAHLSARLQGRGRRVLTYVTTVVLSCLVLTLVLYRLAL